MNGIFHFINRNRALHHTFPVSGRGRHPTNGASYILNVSSLGIDRPLKTERDFARNAGKEIEVGFYAPVDGKKRIVGVLEEYDKEGFCIRTEKGGLVEIKYSAAASVKPVIKF